MSLVVSSLRVKEKCGIDNTDYDTQIANLIADWVPVIEYALQDGFLNDVSNVGLQATLNLGATELVSGEFMAQFARKPGAYEAVVLGDLSLRPVFVSSAIDPSGMKSQGLERVRPFLKKDPLIGSLAQVGVSTGKAGGES